MGYAVKIQRKQRKQQRNLFAIRKGQSFTAYRITYEECVQMVGQMKDSFETDVFGVEKDVMVKLIMNVLISA